MRIRINVERGDDAFLSRALAAFRKGEPIDVTVLGRTFRGVVDQVDIRHDELGALGGFVSLTQIEAADAR